MSGKPAGEVHQSGESVFSVCDHTDWSTEQRDDFSLESGGLSEKSAGEDGAFPSMRSDPVGGIRIVFRHGSEGCAKQRPDVKLILRYVDKTTVIAYGTRKE